MSGGSKAFVDYFGAMLNIGDRRILVRNEHQLGGKFVGDAFKPRVDDVYVNYVNLPKDANGGSGGGAEAENNRMSFWVRGFDAFNPDKDGPTGKVKVEMANSALPRSYKLRAKTGSPASIAKYLADFINKVAAEVSPNFTHSKR